MPIELFAPFTDSCVEVMKPLIESIPRGVSWQKILGRKLRDKTSNLFIIMCWAYSCLVSRCSCHTACSDQDSMKLVWCPADRAHQLPETWQRNVRLCKLSLLHFCSEWSMALLWKSDLYTFTQNNQF